MLLHSHLLRVLLPTTQFLLQLTFSVKHLVSRLLSRIYFHLTILTWNSPASPKVNMQHPVAAPPFRVNLSPPVAAPVAPPGNDELLDAALNGNWNAVEGLLQQNPHMALNSYLNDENETSLHIATRDNKRAFVEKLVTHLSGVDLALPTKGGETALSIAATSGFTDIAKILIEKYHEPPNLINDIDLQQSLIMALQSGQKEMALYLLQRININNINRLQDEDRASLFVATVMNEMYDKALDMLQNFQNLAHLEVDRRLKLTALQVLVQKRQGIFRSGVVTAIRYICSWICGERDCKYSTVAYQLLEKIWDQYLKLREESYETLVYANPKVFFEAIKLGNVKFLSFLGKIFTIRRVREDDKKMLNVAISHRKEKMFNLIFKVGKLRYHAINFIDADGNNMLHLAGKLPTVEELDAAGNIMMVKKVEELQMQQELFWFKEMQKIMPPGSKMRMNKRGLTPEYVFSEEHRDLIITDRTAMKETAKTYISVSIGICAIVGAALFILPGVAITKGRTETRIFHKDTWSQIFFVSNFVAMIFSVLSMISSLLILASGFVEIKYKTSVLANRFGVTAQRISIACMVIVFMAAAFLMFEYKSAWVPPFAASLAIITVIFLLSMQIGLHYLNY